MLSCRALGGVSVSACTPALLITRARVTAGKKFIAGRDTRDLESQVPVHYMVCGDEMGVLTKVNQHLRVRG